MLLEWLSKTFVRERVKVYLDHRDMPVIYSPQAFVMIKNMPDFDKDAFEKWWWQQQRSVGSQNLLQYMIQKDRESK